MCESLTADIIETIADRENVKPDDLDFVLADYIDPDAVQQLSGQGNSTWKLEFELPDHIVTVTSDGEIFVDDYLKKS